VRPRRIASGLVGFGLVVALSACEGPARGDGTDIEAAAARIDTARLAAQIRDLSDDSMLGRLPSSPGEERAVRYLAGRFEALGLEPGGPDGSWFQEVPLVEIVPERAPTPVVTQAGTRHALAFGEDLVGGTRRFQQRIALEHSPLVFAGYGIVAPERGWDDYAGLDARGKTVVVLVNDPGYATGDTALFSGRSMTYYGRWTYKYEEAARHGAAGVLVVHSTGPAGYPWDVVRTGWSGSQFVLEETERDVPRAGFEGWLSEDAARRLVGWAGLDYDSLAAAALEPGFRSVPLGSDLSVDMVNRLLRSTSRNVLARLPGRERPDEHVLYMAHWDHLGTGPAVDGDSIWNGALDNASGTAGLLEIAGAFAALEPRPARSVLFLAVTAEEQGLLGSGWYADHPVYPLSTTVAAINMDGLNIWGPTADLTVIGLGRSDLDSVLAAAADGRVLAPDPEPEEGHFFRSDHFSLARRGVPALYVDAGIQDLEHGAEWARARRDEFTAERYHTPADEYDPTWDLSGAVEDLHVLFGVGYRLAQSDAWPEWNEGTEFRAIRERSRRESDAD
jgi:Zn-dependent M28 family amino/carboxypeptidase